MEKELNCDFYFGENTLAVKVPKLDYSIFQREVRTLRFSRIASNFYWLHGALKLCFKPYKQYIVTGEPYGVSSWLILIINRIMGKKTYLWSHGWYGSEGRLRKRVKKLYFNLSNGVFLYGNYAKNLMIQEGISEHKLHVIYNSLDYDRQKELRVGLEKQSVYQEHFANDWPVVIFVGRLRSNKKLELLVEAQHLALERGVYEFNLVIIGEGESRQSLEELAQQFGTARNIWFFGPCYDEEKLARLIFSADLCVSPGNVGLTALHTLSYGTPVITHDNFSSQMPEFESIEAGRSGDFFKEDSARDLCSKIGNWFDAHPEKSDALIENCTRRIDRYFNPHHQIQVLTGVVCD